MKNSHKIFPLRLTREMSDQLTTLSDDLHINQTEIIRMSLKKFAEEIESTNIRQAMKVLYE